MDNTELPTGSGGDTVRTLEDAGGIKWPAGVTAFASTVGTPDVLEVVTPTSGLPVQQQTGAVFNVLDTNSAAMAASLAIMDDWDESDRAKVNLIVGQAGITGGAGAVAANTPRVTLASDDPAVTALQLIDDAVFTDDAAFTPATSKVLATGFLFDDTSPDTVDEGDIGIGRMSSRREQYTVIRDGAGNQRSANVNASGALAIDIVSQTIGVTVTGNVTTASETGDGLSPPTKISIIGAYVDETAINTRSENEVGWLRMTEYRQLLTRICGADDANRLDIDASGHAQVDLAAFSASLPAGTNNIGDVDVLSVVPGTGATSLGKAEDEAHASADVGVMALAVRKATPINLSGTDGDYEPLQVSDGRLWTSTTGTVAVTSVGASENIIGKVRICGNGSDVASVFDLLNANPLAVALVDGSGDQITSLNVTEASAAAIKTAVELIDNAIDGTEMQVDVVAALPTGTNAIGKVGHDTTGLGHGVTTVTTAGTDVALAGSTACKWVIVQAQTDNTSLIAVGASGVDATIATGTGVILEPGDAVTITTDNLADVFIDSLVNGEGVRYTYGT